MLSLYLLRHGETEFSHQGRFCGRIDAGLTSDGRAMAERFADAYGELPWRAIVTSSRRRAVDTAAPIAARTGLEIRRERRLDEMFYGDWQGLSKAEAALRDEGRFARWLEDPSIGPPRGETPHEVSARALDAIDDLCARHAGGNVLVVSHKALLRILVCRLFGRTVGDYRRVPDWPVCALTRIDVDADGPALRAYADLGHLAEPAPAGAPEATALRALMARPSARPLRTAPGSQPLHAAG